MAVSDIVFDASVSPPPGLESLAAQSQFLAIPPPPGLDVLSSVDDPPWNDPSEAETMHKMFLWEKARLEKVNADLRCLLGEEQFGGSQGLNKFAAEFVPGVAIATGFESMCWPTRYGSPVTTQPPSDANEDVADMSDLDTDDDLELPRTEITLLVRHLPKHLTTTSFLEVLNEQGFHGDYDFCYMPVKFESGELFGYAFVNLVSEKCAERFRKHFVGFNAWAAGEDVPCEVELATGTQGRLANIERYRNSAIMHASVPQEFKPVLLSMGRVVLFPAPVKPIKTPRFRACAKAPLMSMCGLPSF